MTQCYQCQDVTRADLEPCPNDPPCKPYDVCGYQVTRCRHKTEAADAPEAIGGDDEEEC